MASKIQIQEKVQQIFNDQFGGEELDWQRTWADYNFSSIQLVYFLKDLEDAFGPIPIEEFYDLANAEDLVRYLLIRAKT